MILNTLTDSLPYPALLAWGLGSTAFAKILKSIKTMHLISEKSAKIRFLIHYWKVGMHLTDDFNKIYFYQANYIFV